MSADDQATFPNDWVKKLGDLNLRLGPLDISELSGEPGYLTVWSMLGSGKDQRRARTHILGYERAVAGLQLDNRFVWLDGDRLQQLRLALQLGEDIARIRLSPPDLAQRGLTRLDHGSKEAQDRLGPRFP